MNILSQIDLTKIFNPEFLFQASPDPGGLFLLTLVVYGLMIIGAIALGVVSRRNRGSKYRKLWRQFIYFMLTIGLIGPVLVFFRWQSIPYLGSRLVALALWIVALAWLLQIIFYWLFVLPQEVKAKIEKENFEKYLPKKS
jgi:hypothetical protein